MLHAIGAQGGYLHGPFVAPAAQRHHQRHPADEALVLHVFFEFFAGLVRRVVALQKVLGVREVAAVLGEEVDEAWVRLVEDVLEREVVDLYEGAAEHHARGDRRHLLIQPDIVEVEAEVFGR